MKMMSNKMNANAAVLGGGARQARQVVGTSCEEQAAHLQRSPRLAEPRAQVGGVEPVKLVLGRSPSARTWPWSNTLASLVTFTAHRCDR